MISGVLSPVVLSSIEIIGIARSSNGSKAYELNIDKKYGR